MAESRGLDQSEIDRLLSGLNADSASSASGGAAEGEVDPIAFALPGHQRPRSPHGRNIRLYDFKQPDKLSKDQLRTLEIVHVNLARSIGFTLTANTRTSVQVGLMLLEQKRFKEYLEERPDPCVMNLLSLDPLPGRFIIELDFELSYLLLDRLLGGPGKILPPGRNITEIEISLIRTLVNSLLYSLREMWSGIIDVRPRLEDTTLNPQLVQIALPSDVVVVIVFEVRLLGLTGAITMCIPHSLIEPIIPQLSAEVWLSQKKIDNEEQISLLNGHLSGMRVPVAARLGEAKVPVEQILQFEVGDVLMLDSPVDQPIAVVVGDQKKFTAQPGIRGARYAVQVLGVIEEDDPQ